MWLLFGAKTICSNCRQKRINRSIQKKDGKFGFATLKGFNKILFTYIRSGLIAFGCAVLYSLYSFKRDMLLTQQWIRWGDRHLVSSMVQDKKRISYWLLERVLHIYMKSINNGATISCHNLSSEACSNPFYVLSEPHHMPLHSFSIILIRHCLFDMTRTSKYKCMQPIFNRKLTIYEFFVRIF